MIMTSSLGNRFFHRPPFSLSALLSIAYLTAASLPVLGAESVLIGPEQQKKAGISIQAAGEGEIRQILSVPGKVVINSDRIAHVIPRVAGVVRDVLKSTGDQVRQGDLMAIVDSTEIADARAKYLEANARKKLALSTFNRKETLWKEDIASKQSLEEAKQLLDLTVVEERSAGEKLMALNVPLMESNKSGHAGKDLNRYEIRAPFNGWILERDVVIGEATQPDARVFTLGNLESVWVDLNVYPKDLDRISVGQDVKIISSGKRQEMLAKIIYIRPIVSEETRSTVVRAILDNRSNQWQPGLFVTGEIVTDASTAPVVIPRAALQTMRNHPVVFVEDNSRFIPRQVTLGRGDSLKVEVVEGLVAGEHYVATGSFTLKSELEKSESE